MRSPSRRDRRAARAEDDQRPPRATRRLDRGLRPRVPRARGRLAGPAPALRPASSPTCGSWSTRSTYPALASGRVDVIDVFSTDGQLARLDLVLLADDRRFFPDYAAVLLARRSLRGAVPADVGRARAPARRPHRQRRDGATQRPGRPRRPVRSRRWPRRSWAADPRRPRRRRTAPRAAAADAGAPLARRRRGGRRHGPGRAARHPRRAPPVAGPGRADGRRACSRRSPRSPCWPS